MAGQHSGDGIPSRGVRMYDPYLAIDVYVFRRGLVHLSAHSGDSQMGFTLNLPPEEAEQLGNALIAMSQAAKDKAAESGRLEVAS